MKQTSTEGFWQDLSDRDLAHGSPYVDRFTAQISERKYLYLPLRALPRAGNRAIGSIIISQASFAVLDCFAMSAVSSRASVMGLLSSPPNVHEQKNLVAGFMLSVRDLRWGRHIMISEGAGEPI
jgi:hypothetical protein